MFDGKVVSTLDSGPRTPGFDLQQNPNRYFIRESHFSSVLSFGKEVKLSYSYTSNCIVISCSGLLAIIAIRVAGF